MSTKMIPAKLIIGGRQKERLDRAFRLIKKFLGPVDLSRGHPDLVVAAGETSLGIEAIREVQRRLAFQPYQAPLKIALLPEAEKLTIPAQNALLKTLEEPPAKSWLILLTPQKETLLPTIVSRCQIISLTQKAQIEPTPKDQQKHRQQLRTILAASAGQRVKLAGQFRSRPEALELVDQFLFIWRELLLAKTGAKSKSLTGSLKKLSVGQIKRATENTQLARQGLLANVNPLLMIENLFLSWPRF